MLVLAGDRILRIIIAGDAAGAIAAVDEFSGSLDEAHHAATEHGAGIASAFSSIALKVAAVAAGVTVAAGVIADELYKMGAPYEQLLNQIQAFTHATNEQIQSLSSYLYQISPQLAQYGLTSEDAADAVAKLTKAGLSLGEAQSAVLPVLALAKAGMIDAGDAANFVAEAMNVWGLKASDATMIANALVGASHSSTASVEDLGNSLSFSAAAAAHAGLTYQQTAAFLAEVANAGVQGSKAGTALKDILVNLEVPTSSASKAMDKLGISVFNSKGKMNGMSDLIGQLHTKLSGLSEQQQDIYVKDIFGKIPLESALTIIKGGTGAYQKYLDLVSQTGEASRIAGAKSAGLSGAIARTGAQFESMGQALYLKVAPTFTRIVNDFASELPKLGGLAAKASTMLGGIFSRVGGSGKASGMFSSIGASLSSAFRDAVPLVKSEMKSLDEVFNSAKAQGVFKALGGALTAVGSLVKGTVLPEFKQFIDFLVKDIEPPAVNIFEHEILPAIRSFAEFISGTLVPKLKLIEAALQPLVSFVEAFIVGKLVPLISWAIGQLKPVFSELGGVISSLFDVLLPLIKFLTPIIEWLVNVLSGPVISAVKGFFNGIVRIVSGLLTILKGVLDFLAGVFTGNWSKAWHGISEIFSGALNALIGFVKAIFFGKMIEMFGDAFGAIGDLFKSGANLIKDGFVDLGKWIFDFWKADFKDQLKIILDGATAVKNFFVTAVKWFEDVLSGGWKSAISDVEGFGRNILSSVTKAFNELVSTVVLKMIDFVAKIVEYGEKADKWFEGLPGMILRSVSDAGTWLLQAGEDVVNGLIKGIESKAGDAVKSITGLGTKIANGFKKVLGIFSPSRVFRAFGVNTMEGYNEGTVSMTTKVQAAMNKLGSILPNIGAHKLLQAAIGGSGVSIAGVPGLTAGSSLAAQYGSMNGMPPVIINVAGHVATEKGLAKAIAPAVRDAIRQIGRKNGGATGLN